MNLNKLFLWSDSFSDSYSLKAPEDKSGDFVDKPLAALSNAQNVDRYLVAGCGMEHRPCHVLVMRHEAN